MSKNDFFKSKKLFLKLKFIEAKEIVTNKNEKNSKRNNFKTNNKFKNDQFKVDIKEMNEQKTKFVLSNVNADDTATIHINVIKLQTQYYI